MSEPLLSVEDLSIAFGGVRALGGVSFDVPAGAIGALIGPNGAGKSTLFNCVTGIYRPDTGDVRLEGRSLRGARPDQVAALGVARTFQNIELFSHMSVLQNVLLGRHRHMRAGVLGGAFFSRRVVKEEVAQRRRAEEILDFLDLQFARDQLIMHLPYGVRKKVELARALALEPRLLLLDEPSAGMTSEERQDMIHYVRDIRDEMDVTVLLVEHDMGLVMDISDRVVVLEQGRLIADGEPAVIANDPEVIRAYLGDDQEDTAAEAPRAGLS